VDIFLLMTGWDQTERWKGPFASVEDAEKCAVELGWQCDSGVSVNIIRVISENRHEHLKQVGDYQDPDEESI
jgi:hypothetical protein